MQFFARPQRTFESRVASVVSSATVLGLVIAGLSLGGIPLSAAAATTSPLSSLKNFTVLTEANFTTEGSAHEVEGSAAVGGDMIINKAYILGSPHNSVALPLLENRSTQLLVGGTLRLGQSGEALQTNAGSVRIRNVAGHSVSTGGAPQSQGNNFIADSTPANRLRMPASTTIAAISAGTLFTDAFGSAFTELRANSSMIAGYTSADVALISFINGTNFNGVSGSDKGLELVPNKVNVVRATAAQVSAIGTIKFLGPQGQQNTATLPSASTLLIFDITDSGSVSLTAPEQNINAQAFTVWNFANATALTVQGKGGSGYLKGSILAPNADMIFAAGYIEGQIAVKSLVVRSGGEIHHVTYGGDLPDPRTVSASPTFSDGTCAPSNRTNTLAAPAVDHVEYTWTANPTASLVGTKFASFSNTALPAGTYAFSIAATDGYTLSGASSFSHTFAEPPADCRVKDATGTFSFTPPTCTVAASYTLGTATNATYTVSNGTTTETGKTAGTYPAQNGVTYTITIVPNDGHALATGTLESDSRTFSAPTDCVTVDASGSFSFTPPTCEAGGSYTLGAATNATYTVAYGSTTETGKTAGTTAMPNGVAYTITVVPNAGHALVAGVAAPETRTFSAPTNCVTTDATGSFSFTPPTCQAEATYTLGAATNATYTVTYGSTTETAKTAGSYAMQAGVEYTVTVVPNSGHALMAGVVVSGSQSFEAVTGCVVQNATASFSFTPPTCTAEASYTLGTPTNATYTVTYGSTTETGKTAGNFPMQTGVEYTVTVVPNPGHALVARAIASDSRTFRAPTDCIVSDATGSFAFVPPTCEAPAGSYTLGAASNATYTVAYGSTVETPAAGPHAMPNGVAYTITLMPDAGHALAPGVAATETRTFSAPTGCVSPNARGSFQFTPPTCEVDATYTLNAATNATYRVTTSTGRSTTVEEGTHPMDLDSTYTIAVVPDEGYALADGVVESDSETFSAPVDCVEQNATGSFSFVPPTCEAGAAYTLNAATNATYTVSFGSTTLTGRTAGTFSMANDVEYTITVVANDGHSLVQGIVPGSQTYAAPANCETTDAVGNFSFTPPTCTTDASYTLDAVTNASYTVTHGSTTETGKGPGSYSMELGVDYTITVVPNAGHALVGGAKSQTQAYDALTNCTYVDTDPYGSTCTAQGDNVPPAGMTSWIWFLIDDRVIYTIDGNPERVTTPFVEVTPGVHVAHAVAAPGFVLAPSAEREWTINVVDSSVCGEVTAPTIKAQLSTACFANVPWIDYSIELIDPDNQASNRDAELILTNGTETETIALGTIGESNVIEGRILWPGAAVDADGKAAGWPGWQKTAAGEWVETTGNFAWTRALTSMTASVNPVAETAISYPAATSECANPPVPPTVLKALVNTGVGVAGTLWFAAALAALGVLGLFAARRSRREAR